jgi:hypothetical protein
MVIIGRHGGARPHAWKTLKTSNRFGGDQTDASRSNSPTLHPHGQEVARPAIIR